MVTFRTLDPSSEARQRQSFAFVTSVLIQVLLLASAGLVTVLMPQEIPQVRRHYALTWLQAEPPEKPAVALPRPPVHLQAPRLAPPETAKMVVPPPPPKREPPKEVPPPPTVAKVHVPEPPAPSAAAPAAASFPVASAPPKARIQPDVHTGMFGGGPQLASTKLPAREVQTGGFGSPEGLPGRAHGGNPGNVPALGSFSLPQGPGVGNGTGGTHGVQAVVASAGFGPAVAGGMGDGHPAGGTLVAVVAGFGPGTGNGPAAAGPAAPVAVGGFGNESHVTATPKKAVVAPEQVEFRPVEILSKPSPVYTEEARRLGIQGEVALSVVFEASGEMRVVSVVKSLGHGLDEAAEQAAAQIRFKPAQRDSKPADFPATLRIEFRLAT